MGTMVAAIPAAWRNDDIEDEGYNESYLGSFFVVIVAYDDLDVALPPQASRKKIALSFDASFLFCLENC